MPTAPIVQTGLLHSPVCDKKPLQWRKGRTWSVAVAISWVSKPWLRDAPAHEVFTDVERLNQILPWPYLTALLLVMRAH
jgi:hypothetical protein